MALTKCKVVSCSNQKPRRFFICSDCWGRIPKEFRMDVRYGTEKGSHTLRSTPAKGWIESVFKYVGLIKVPFVMGSGYSAVKVAADKREV